MKRQNSKQFTLLELLIVIAVMAILLSLLLPSLMSAREKAKFAVCVSNRNQNFKMIMNGTSDNSSKMPVWFSWGTKNTFGEWYKNNNIVPDYEREDWMGTNSWRLNKHNRGYKTAIVNPVAGLYSGHTNWTYTVDEAVVAGQHPLSEILRCPSLERGKWKEGGSNGAFDYSFVQAYRGQSLAKMDNIVTWYGEEMAAPLIMEEDPKFNINNSNKETAWGNGDRLGRWHDFGKKGSYTAIDGSVVIVWPGREYNGYSDAMMYIGGNLKSIRSVNSGGGVPRVATTLEGNKIERW